MIKNIFLKCPHTQKMWLWLFQGDEWGCRQSGWCQQSARHRLHRLQNIAEHRWQRQGKHTHTQTHSVLSEGCVEPSYDLITAAAGWACVCFWCVFEGVSSVQTSSRKRSRLCSADEVRLICFTFEKWGEGGVRGCALWHADPASCVLLYSWCRNFSMCVD